jgi:hypothetical protein
MITALVEVVGIAFVSLGIFLVAAAEECEPNFHQSTPATSSAIAAPAAPPPIAAALDDFLVAAGGPPIRFCSEPVPVDDNGSDVNAEAEAETETEADSDSTPALLLLTATWQMWLSIPSTHTSLDKHGLPEQSSML